MNSSKYISFLLVLMTLYCSVAAQASEIFMLDDAFVEDVSADGTTVLMDEKLWRPRTGRVTLLPAEHWGARSISGDGSVVVGGNYHNNGFPPVEAFRWTEQDGFIPLGRPLNGSSFAHDVSSDGSVVVGQVTPDGGGSSAFRWTEQTGMVQLGTPAGRDTSWAVSISADGSVFAGNATRGNFPYEAESAFRWTEESGMVDLGGLPNKPLSRAWDISADGSTVVGWAAKFPHVDEPPVEAFRWTQETGMVGLGFLPGWEYSAAYVASTDGSLVLGSARGDERLDRELFAWSESTGMISLTDILFAEVGVELLGGTFVRGISADNRTIVGDTQDIHPNGDFFSNAWAVVLDEPLDVLLSGSTLRGDYNANGTVEQADLDLVLSNWGSPATPRPANWTHDLPTGNIDQEELDRVLANWGDTRTAATAAVPEPATAVLLSIAFTVLAVHARWGRNPFSAAAGP